jgi:hypothetical protein
MCETPYTWAPLGLRPRQVSAFMGHEASKNYFEEN